MEVVLYHERKVLRGKKAILNLLRGKEFSGKEAVNKVVVTWGRVLKEGVDTEICEEAAAALGTRGKSNNRKSLRVVVAGVGTE